VVNLITIMKQASPDKTSYLVNAEGTKPLNPKITPEPGSLGVPVVELGNICTGNTL
jgi:hypothetical protein